MTKKGISGLQLSPPTQRTISVQETRTNAKKHKGSQVERTKKVYVTQATVTGGHSSVTGSRCKWDEIRTFCIAVWYKCKVLISLQCRPCLLRQVQQYDIIRASHRRYRTIPVCRRVCDICYMIFVIYRKCNRNDFPRADFANRFGDLKNKRVLYDRSSIWYHAQQSSSYASSPGAPRR